MEWIFILAKCQGQTAKFHLIDDDESVWEQCVAAKGVSGRWRIECLAAEEESRAWEQRAACLTDWSIMTTTQSQSQSNEAN